MNLFSNALFIHPSSVRHNHPDAPFASNRTAYRAQPTSTPKRSLLTLLLPAALIGPIASAALLPQTGIAQEAAHAKRFDIPACRKALRKRMRVELYLPTVMPLRRDDDAEGSGILQRRARISILRRW
ncbi:MAG: hypothetical protein ACFCUJ_16050 [Thiotrichales bacterium]